MEAEDEDDEFNNPFEKFIKDVKETVREMRKRHIRQLKNQDNEWGGRKRKDRWEGQNGPSN